MKEVESYKIAWNTPNNEGAILLQVAEGIERLHIDSATEGAFLVDILRHEKPVYVKDGVLFTGFEMVGEGDVDAS